MLHKSSSASFSSFLIWRKWDRGRFESGEGGSLRQFSNNQLNISNAPAATAGKDNLTVFENIF